MNPLGGLSAFFYNIIPGILFLLAVYFLNLFSIKSYGFPSDGVLLFFVLILGSFLGFSGQAIFRIMKDILGVNRCAFCEVKNDNDQTYNKAVKNLCVIYGKLPKDFTLKEVFYSMDNFLRNNGSPYIINHYSERAAFWGNISLGSFALFILIALNIILNYRSIGHGELVFAEISAVGLLTLIFISFYIACGSVFSQYESILQTYVQKSHKPDL